MAPRPDVSQERVEQILNAATSVFARLGFNNARMDDIVAESGLSKGTLYWYFKSKDDLIKAILDGMFEGELVHLRDLITSQGSVSERLIELTQRVIDDLQGMTDLLPIAYEFYSLAFRQETVRQTLQGYFRSYIDILAPLIQQGIDRGEFQPVSSNQAAIAVSAIIEGTLLLWVADPETVNPNEHILTGVSILLEGLKANQKNLE
jgi:AcrR family transcriptional regulator